jgi:hypothetical protein
MSDYVARERLYHTVDRSEVVKEGDPRAAFLLVSAGTELSEGEVKRLKLESFFEPCPAPDPALRTRTRMEDALERGALEEAQSHQQALARLELAKEAGVGPVVFDPSRASQPTATVPAPRVPRAERAAARRDAERAEAMAGPGGAEAERAAAAEPGGGPGEAKPAGRGARAAAGDGEKK